MTPDIKLATHGALSVSHIVGIENVLAGRVDGTSREGRYPGRGRRSAAREGAQTRAIAKVMELVSVVAMLPPASSMVTVGWVPKGLPALASPGWMVKTSCAGAPTVTSNAELVFVRLSAVSVAVRTSPLLAMSIVQPLKVVTPAAVDAVHPERVPGPVVSVKVGDRGVVGDGVPPSVLDRHHGLGGEGRAARRASGLGGKRELGRHAGSDQDRIRGGRCQGAVGGGECIGAIGIDGTTAEGNDTEGLGLRATRDHPGAAVGGQCDRRTVGGDCVPPASSTVTVGWVVKAVPPVAVGEGSVVKTSWDAAPTVTSNAALGALNVSPVSLAVKMSPVPAVLIVQPLKAATPPVVVDVQPESVPVLGSSQADGAGVRCDRVTAGVFDVTVGWVVKAVPPVAPAGSVVNTRSAGGPTVTSNADSGHSSRPPRRWR